MFSLIPIAHSQSPIAYLFERRDALCQVLIEQALREWDQRQEAAGVIAAPVVFRIQPEPVGLAEAGEWDGDYGDWDLGWVVIA